MIDEKIHLALRAERRRYTCHVCGQQREIIVRRIEKNVVICVHSDTQGGTLPILALREEGELIVE